MNDMFNAPFEGIQKNTNFQKHICSDNQLKQIKMKINIENPKKKTIFNLIYGF